MEQMYLVEIFVDKVSIYAEEDEESSSSKNLIIKIKFGPKVQFIVKEGQLAHNDVKIDDIIECDENGKRKWSRTIRVGKSYLFPSYPDTVLMTLSKFPLEIEVWNDDETEIQIFVGIGTMHWETQFFHYLKDTADSCKMHESLALKQVTPLYAECCCKRVGDISLILRMSALGESIITEFQQLMNNPEAFVFRTNKAPSMFQCTRVEGDDPNFNMIGTLYETATLEDPDVIANANKTIEVCTELQSCSTAPDKTCDHSGAKKEAAKKKHPIDKIRMGDITGPCGNSNCPLAHKVRTYIRNLESYRKETSGRIIGEKGATKKICGACQCKDDKYHRDKCPEAIKDAHPICEGCGGIAQKGETCIDKANKLRGTGLTPRGSSSATAQQTPTAQSPNKSNVNTPKVSKTHVGYMIDMTKDSDLVQSLFGKDYFVGNFTTQILRADSQKGCCCHGRLPINSTQTQNENYISCSSRPDTKPSSHSLGFNNQQVYNAFESKESKPKVLVYNCLEIPDDKDCKCNPVKPSPPCKTNDCECLTETFNIAARKKHKAYCPLYKHKSTCPVTMMQDEEDKKKDEYEEDEAEPLPYGLPPIQLGPCPVLGRPCTVPDGFARMYKTAAMPTQPPSYSEAGKVCCSKEYERIKKAIKEYMKNDKESDYRCVNKFNVDTERRCCDKEQLLLSLMGKSCCGSHKIAIHDKFKDDKEREKKT